jgi:hypothetical protein
VTFISPPFSRQTHSNLHVFRFSPHHKLYYFIHPAPQGKPPADHGAKSLHAVSISFVVRGFANSFSENSISNCRFIIFVTEDVRMLLVSLCDIMKRPPSLANSLKQKEAKTQKKSSRYVVLIVWTGRPSAALSLSLSPLKRMTSVFLHTEFVNLSKHLVVLSQSCLL